MFYLIVFKVSTVRWIVPITFFLGSNPFLPFVSPVFWHSFHRMCFKGYAKFSKLFKLANTCKLCLMILFIVGSFWLQAISVIDFQKIQKTSNKWKTFPITDEPNVTQTSCLLLKIRSWTVNKQKKKLFHYVSSLRFLKREFCLQTLPLQVHPEEIRVLSVVGLDAKIALVQFCVLQWMPVFQCYLLWTTLERRSTWYLWKPSCQFSSHSLSDL